MTRPIIKLENELQKELWRLCDKYGFKDLCTTGTIDPAYYDNHKKIPSCGMSIMFYDGKVK